MYKVLKRDGTTVDFNKEKIINAINKAFVEVDGALFETDTAEDIAQDIEQALGDRTEPIPVENIQN